MSHNTLELTSQNFDKEVTKSSVPVLADFWADWCGPCKALTPVIEEIAKESAGKFKVVKVNVDDSPQLATKWDVMNIPTLILFKSGKEAQRLVGYMSKTKILAAINSAL